MSLDINSCYASDVAFYTGYTIESPVMSQRQAALKFTHPLPYGAIIHDGGVQFAVFSRSATAMRVLLYDGVDDPEPTDIIEFDPDLNRWGHIWSVFVPGTAAGQLYHFQADGPHEPQRGYRFDPQARLIDPYCKALAGDFLPAEGGILRPPKCVVTSDEFDWQGDRHLRRNLSETIIYETHVRGFTQSPCSKVENPGTYLGIIEKIPYLKSLGITAIELMPVHEFPILDCFGNRPPRPNYWGYDPLCFFAPHRGYTVSKEPGAQVREFKEMVRALHAAGIEVILDVVFNHTAEGNECGPTLSLKGLENRVYYMLENGGQHYRNYTGCGNTLNGNHPIVREMIFDCLRHWVHNYHVDGFRFDLASILSRDRDGNLVPNPPVVETISEDPQLADTKIIAEAWDAAGAYQVGTFGSLRWAEWNGRYRDDVRRFWRGDPNMIGPMATRLAGSSDLYQANGRRPYHSINFITSHDGFPLNDLVSYNAKHNEANGEGNRDGDNNNFCCNYGHEGLTTRRAIENLRIRQIKNMMATNLLSQGVPMILFGDECRRTQQGNNNAYCQDNAISWFDWRLVQRNDTLIRFVQALIAFRRSEPTTRRTDFLTGQPVQPGGLPDVSWYNPAGGAVDWSHGGNSLMCVLGAVPRRELKDLSNHHLLIVLHSSGASQKFVFPKIVRSYNWRQFVNTGAPSPKDIYPDLNGPTPATDWTVELESRSLVCYIARDEA